MKDIELIPNAPILIESTRSMMSLILILILA